VTWIFGPIFLSFLGLRADQTEMDRWADAVLRGRRIEQPIVFFPLLPPFPALTILRTSPLLSSPQGLLYIRQYILVMSSRILFRAATASSRASLSRTCLFHTQLHSLSTSARPARTWTGVGIQAWNNNNKALISIHNSGNSTMNQTAPFSTGSGKPPPPFPFFVLSRPAG